MVEEFVWWIVYVDECVIVINKLGELLCYFLKDGLWLLFVGVVCEYFGVEVVYFVFCFDWEMSGVVVFVCDVVMVCKF